MKNETISVPSISCNHCKASIEGALRGVDGVELVHVDVEGKVVEVEFDEARVALPEIRAAIEDQGHEVAPDAG